ncbi:energy transducer TonB [Thiohalorhabdus sp.]|uniref:energy transducer TonB n=1 Tax=Thiohalorhabdus sp. TaxID=3094134 RepID=UPI002FC2F55D
MALQAIRPDPDPNLSVALLVSAVLHVVVLLGLGFLAPDGSGESKDKVLHMVDYMPESTQETAPESPEARSASRSQQARGQDRRSQEATAPDAGRNPSPPRPAPEPATDPETAPEPETAGAPEPPGAEGSDQAPVLQAEDAPAEVAAPSEAGDPAPEASAKGSEKETLQMFPSDREVARWDDERQRRQAAADTAGKARNATREDAVAAYTTSLLNKVQRVGNMNYPEEARDRGITGKVRLQMHIRPDGSLASVAVLESSGSEILDASAKRILRLAAPFSPFPDGMSRSHPETYTISHYLNFTRGGELGDSPSG